MELLALDQLAREYKDRGEEAFRRKYPHPFLLVAHIPSVDSDVVDPQTIESQLGDLPAGDEPPIGRKAIAVAKSDRNAYESKILVGRSKNNDLVIRAPKISKLHAAFAVRKGAMILTDMGSANGTRVNGRKLKEKDAVTVDSGDRIHFWRYEFEYHDPDSFIRMLKIVS